MLVGHSRYMHLRLALSQSLVYPDLGAKRWVLLIDAPLSAPPLLLHLFCFYSTAVTFLLFSSCFFSLLCFSCCLSPSSLLPYIFSPSVLLFLSRNIVPSFSIPLFLSSFFSLYSFVLLLYLAFFFFLHFFLFFSVAFSLLLLLISRGLKFFFRAQRHFHLQNVPRTTASV